MESILEHLHRVELMIMDEVDRICRKHDIQYFLDSGSALGAIRHAGFIPWDDDIDVGMLREDYEHFLTVAQDELPHEYFLQTKKTDPTFTKYCAKVRLNGTYFPEKTTPGTEYHHGIFIDIFPFDPISSHPIIARLQIKYSRLCWRMLRFRQRKDKPTGIKGVLICIVRMIPYSFFDKQYRFSCKHSFSRRKKMVTCYAYKMFQSHDLWFELNRIVPIKDVSFEGRNYMIMNDADYFLKVMFGDYMQLPPVEKRLIHIDGEIGFGSY